MRRLLLISAALVLLAVSVTPSGASSTGVFIVKCALSHSLPDDPIVFPGQPGASHLHDFVGAETTDAYSTVDSLRAGGTNCVVPEDTSGYWMPALYIDGVKKAPSVKVQAYYSAAPAAIGKVEAFPTGMQLVAGNSHATAPQDLHVTFWQCNGSGANLNHPPTGCRTAELSVRFPWCWNGTGLSTADVAYGTTQGLCPDPAFSHILPRLRLRFEYPMAITSADQVTLASGPYWTGHADFMNAWDPARQAQLVADCLNTLGVHCGAIRS